MRATPLLFYLVAESIVRNHVKLDTVARSSIVAPEYRARAGLPNDMKIIDKARGAYFLTLVLRF